MARMGCGMAVCGPDRVWGELQGFGVIRATAVGSGACHVGQKGSEVAGSVVQRSGAGDEISFGVEDGHAF